MGKRLSTNITYTQIRNKVAYLMKSVCRLLSLQEMPMKKQDILDITLKNGISVKKVSKTK
nr:MAG TPA: hypothetical protein [Bacteriophage sp.]